MLIPLSSILIILSLSLFPPSSLGQIYKWTDEKGTVHFAEDPSKLSTEDLSDQEKFKQSPPLSLSTRFKKIEDDLKPVADHKSKGPPQGLKSYEEKSKFNLYYLIGLLIILGIFVRLLREKRPAGIGVRTVTRRSPGLKKRTVLFNVCYKDYSTDSTVVLGKVIERRIRDRGENFRDLLYKARKDFGDRVEDPPDIFLRAS
jgi:hypothetical protein